MEKNIPNGCTVGSICHVLHEQLHLLLFLSLRQNVIRTES